MDPISDMLTRIRNAVAAHKEVVEVPSSRIKREIARVLKEEGFISNFKIFEDGKSGLLKVLLRYTKEKESVITNIARTSKPSRRIFRKASELAKKSDWISTAVISTPRGVMTARQAKSLNLGGEVLLKVW